MAVVPLARSSAQPLLEHLEELRWRLIRSLAAVAIGGLAAFCLRGRLFALVLAPAGPARLVCLTPAESFQTTLMLSAYAGLAIAWPYVLSEAIAFLLPALTARERRWLVPLGIASTGLFALGAWASYALLLPAGLRFLLGFSPGDVHAMLGLGQYVGFVAGLLFAGGVACQLPIALVALGFLGLVSSRMLASFRRYFALIAVALTAIVCPSPDLVSQGAMAGGFYLLYEASVIVLRLTGR